MSRSKPPVICANLISAILILANCAPAVATTGRFSEDPTMWESIERLTVDQLIGTMTLLGLLVILVTVGLARCHAIYAAVKQSRAYESMALTALFYNRAEEAVTACALFPKSPLARVVAASLESFSDCSPIASINPSNPAFQRAVVAQSIMLKRRLWILGTIGWSSPAIGLVCALTTSSHYGGGPPITFCLGLLIAIPAVWLHRGLTGEVETLLFEADRMSLSIVDQISEQENQSRVRIQDRSILTRSLHFAASPPAVE